MQTDQAICGQMPVEATCLAIQISKFIMMYFFFFYISSLCVVHTGCNVRATIINFSLTAHPMYIHHCRELLDLPP